MGKRPAQDESFVGNKGSMRREDSAFYAKRRDANHGNRTRTNSTKARCEPKLRLTSLAHHITQDRVWENLCEIPKDSAPGVDGQTVPERKRASRYGWKPCFSLYTARDIRRRIF